MIVYLAALYSSGVSLHGNFFRRCLPAEQEARRNLRYFLESYHYAHKQQFVDDMRQDGVRVFMDSGAFSAMSLGATISLDAYCQYLHTNADIIHVASVLDGIGDPRKTYENQAAMESNGLRPLPCFHYGEDERYLVHYVDRYPYITLGGMVPVDKVQLRIWLDRIWDKYLTDAQGMPRVKVHGFGLTRQSLMYRYPWYSVDSSSWVQKGRTGAILIPEIGSVTVSNDSQLTKQEGMHYNNMTEPEKAAILYAVSRRGFSLERMQSLYIPRWVFNMMTYNELTDPNAAPKPFKLQTSGFFD